MEVVVPGMGIAVLELRGERSGAHDALSPGLGVRGEGIQVRG